MTSDVLELVQDELYEPLAVRERDRDELKKETEIRARQLLGRAIGLQGA